MHVSRNDSVQAEAGSCSSACCLSPVTGAVSSDTDGFLQWCVGRAPPASSPGRAERGDQPRFFCGSQAVRQGEEKKKPGPTAPHSSEAVGALLWTGGICANERSRGEAQRLEGDCCACKVQTLGAARPWSDAVWKKECYLTQPSLPVRA